MDFKLVSNYTPIPDQNQAISKLVSLVESNTQHITLAAPTGTGKTFTIANVIQKVQKPTLVITHNKTLVAQLYQEFKDFFPENKVEYFVSHFDYFQPESYIPSSNRYIQKDSLINEELNRLRLSAISSLKSGRRDVIVVASVSCIFGAGNPQLFEKHILKIHKGMQISMKTFLIKLTEILYSRNDVEQKYGTFKVKGDTVFISLASNDTTFRVVFDFDSIEEISIINKEGNTVIEHKENAEIYPAYMFLKPDKPEEMIKEIEIDLINQVKYFESEGKYIEAQRLEERVKHDLEMIKELGHCHGMENYSRYIDQRMPGQRAFSLMDYFPEDYLIVMDESHVTHPQIRAMYHGDRSRKETLIDYGFRLPAAFDNRPLKFQEFEEIINQIIYVSATPSDYEIINSNSEIVEQLNRPTGIPDPPIEIKPSKHCVDDLIEQIHNTINNGDRVLVTTISKDFSEKLSEFLSNVGIKCRYLHSEIKTIERSKIIYELRSGIIDVVIGINLLREGLDLPEVALVAILDADKEGFLRDYTALIQTMGRAARNVNGRAILYADNITRSMDKAIQECDRRRKNQIEYNKTYNIIPSSIKKKPLLKNTLEEEITPIDLTKDLDLKSLKKKSKKELSKISKVIEEEMYKASKELDFIEAAKYRDQLTIIKSLK